MVVMECTPCKALACPCLVFLVLCVVSLQCENAHCTLSGLALSGLEYSCTGHLLEVGCGSLVACCCGGERRHTCSCCDQTLMLCNISQQKALLVPVSVHQHLMHQHLYQHVGVFA